MASRLCIARVIECDLLALLDRAFFLLRRRRFGLLLLFLWRRASIVIATRTAAGIRQDQIEALGILSQKALELLILEFVERGVEAAATSLFARLRRALRAPRDTGE